MPPATAPAEAPAPSSSTPSGSPRATPWWVAAFGATYLTVYGHRDDEEARRNAPAIARLLSLRPHARVLDLACGEGRYCRALSSIGFSVTGVDLSEPLLEQARRASPMLPGMPTYVRADMRSLPFGPQFDAVVSLFTSFGYFDDADDDARVLDAVARVLMPGGRFLLDFLSAAHVRAGLVPQSDQHKGPFRVATRRWVDETSPGGPYVRKAIVVTDTRTGDVVSDVEERVRLHEPAALDAMLAAAGLDPLGKAYGGFDGAPFTDASPRWIRVAQRRRRR
jgi:SAM-dependent methyltransferase